MNETNINPPTSYDELAIRSEYYQDINHRIINATKYTLPSYLLTIGGYFVYSDIFIRHIAYLTIWRIPSLLFAAIFLALNFSGFWKKSKYTFFAYSIILVSVCFMSVGFTWALYDTALFKAAINALLVAVFVICIGSYRGAKFLFFYYIPIFILVIAIFIGYPHSLAKMTEFGNVFVLIISCIIVSQVTENLRYREFRFRKIAEAERGKTERALENLKIIQNQLIQAEKLASLGELTAGIAHEIQNPLNFVNNFSTLSIDLAHELKEEINRVELDKELIVDLVTDLLQNQEKINLYGKRASNIVAMMVQHSRPGRMNREATNINNLINDAIKFCYHLFRDKIKDNFIEVEKKLEDSLPLVQVIPSHINTVLVNLISNAFYSLMQRKNGMSANAVNDSTTVDYYPIVMVSTKKLHNSIEIKISDNGIGIPDKHKGKIFQPFFTTKPSGEGTGFGLSLSYDIITKGHAGTLSFNSEENNGADFLVTLPLAPL